VVGGEGPPAVYRDAAYGSGEFIGRLAACAASQPAPSAAIRGGPEEIRRRAVPGASAKDSRLTPATCTVFQPVHDVIDPLLEMRKREILCADLGDVLEVLLGDV
jgi:hypothetical protein